MRDYRLYIHDIIKSMEKITAYTSGMDFEDFIENELVYDAVIRNFEIIGEAAKNLPDYITDEHEDIPWSDMVGMRNILIHGYLGIDDSIVWNTVTILPDYINKLKAMV